jgi:hypothetical protein
MGNRLALCVIVAACTGSHDRSTTTPVSLITLPMPPEMRDLYEWGQHHVDRARELVSNFQKCQQRGGANCEVQAALCTYLPDAFDKYNEAHGGVFAGGVLGDPLSVFKTTCGGEDCFACCHTPGVAGCWSAIPSESGQSIDCNGFTYELGTNIVGDTMVAPSYVGPCLGAPVTCSHLAVCAGGDASAFDPPAVAPDAAAKVRARSYSGQQLGSALANALNDYPAARAKAPVFDFITARGFRSWTAALDTVEPFGAPATGSLASSDAASSYLRAIAMFGDARLLESVPNGYKRLAAVESRLWTKDQAEQALAAAGIADADAELRKTMNGFALEILKHVGELQDYRLLAIPLPDEVAVPDMFAGFELATPPYTTLVASSSSNTLQLAVALHGGAVQDPISIDWGDGSSSTYLYDPAHASYTHAYATAGRKLVFVTAMNASGLRGVTAEIVSIARGNPAAAAPTTLYSVAIDDVRFYARWPIEPGRAVVYLDGVDADGHVFPLGESVDLHLDNAASGPRCSASCVNGQVTCNDGGVPSCGAGRSAACAGTTPVCNGIAAQSFGTIVGHNTTGAQLVAVRLRPILYQSYYAGAEYASVGDGTYFTVGSVTLEARGPNGIRAATSFPVTAGDVRLSTSDGASPPVTAFDGRVRLSLVGQDPTQPCRSYFFGLCNSPTMPALTRIEIPLAGHDAPSIAAQLDLLASSPAYAAGQTSYWIEDRPGRLVVATPGADGLVPSTAPADVTDYDRATLEPTLAAIRVVAPPDGLGAAAPTLTIGVAPVQQFTALATYSDGSIVDVTSEATWSSSSPAIAIAATDSYANQPAPPATTAFAQPPPPTAPNVTRAPGGIATLVSAPAAPVAISATLGGVTGTATGMFVAGTVSPGGVGAIGTWSVAGTFVLGASETLHVDCAPTGVDSIATNAAELGNARLEIAASCARAASPLTIVSARSITGRFAGLADGAIVRVGDQRFALHYAAGVVTLARTRADLVAIAPSVGQWWQSTSTGQAFVNALIAQWSTSATWVDPRVADFDGDGRDDVAARASETGQWWITTAAGTRLFATWGTSVTWDHVTAADFDGDGKADIAGHCKETGQWWVSYAGGATSLLATWSTGVTWVDAHAADFDGDGKADLIGRALETGQWWVTLSSGKTALFATWSTAVAWQGVQVADFDGDGLADIAGMENGAWWVTRNAGWAAGKSPVTYLYAQWSSLATWVDQRVGDFNGDGLPDLAARWLEGGQWWVAYNGGNTVLMATWSTYVSWVDAQVADFDGDGRADIAARALPGGTWWVALTARDGVTPAATTSKQAWGTWSTAVSWLGTSAAEVDGR